jgi:NAD(P)-dependent dehydrogenase (short-subunit alcohol dehydrogenase family)
MDLGLQGKVALVTGAGSQIGFGKGIAMILAEEGCDIIVNDLDIKGAEQTAAEIKALSRQAIPAKADVVNSAEVKDMVKTALKQFGRIDILVNNAGASSPPKPFTETTEEDWAVSINTNLWGVLNCTKAVIDEMVARKSGKIISIVSSAAKNGGVNNTVYGAAKAGVAAFSKGLAVELATSGINVNCIAPGPGNTGFTRQAPPGFLDWVMNMVPLGKMTTPQDIGNMVTFLASERSSDITGQVFSVDGGLTMY